MLMLEESNVCSPSKNGKKWKIIEDNGRVLLMVLGQGHAAYAVKRHAYHGEINAIILD